MIIHIHIVRIVFLTNPPIAILDLSNCSVADGKLSLVIARINGHMTMKNLNKLELKKQIMI